MTELRDLKRLDVWSCDGARLPDLLRSWGLGFTVQGSLFGVGWVGREIWNLGFRVWGLGFGVVGVVAGGLSVGATRGLPQSKREFFPSKPASC